MTINGNGLLLIQVKLEFLVSYDKKSVVMRFAGICDKNGNEIYEGDILKMERRGKYLDYSVSNINIVKFGNYFIKSGQWQKLKLNI